MHIPAEPAIGDRPAAWACDPAISRGRLHRQAAAVGRNEFQRDRDRIVHSTAFRRLVYKTQVFLNHEGDLFRTRLTHSLEVAQIARSMARRLGFHEDLVEAIALAHDLGHTPFGHAGQDALDACVRGDAPDEGGFEHNFQSLRVVDELEEHYPEFDGLNLCFETREGILKHCSAVRARQIEAAEPGGVGARFIEGTRPSLEAQLCNLADEIAYNAHDLDDGVRSGLMSHEQLLEVPICERHHRDALRDHPSLRGRRLLYEMLRRILSSQINDLVSTTHAALLHWRPANVDEVRAMPAIVQGSAGMRADVQDVRVLLRTALYRHPNVVAQTDHARQVVRDLYRTYMTEPSSMPHDHARSEPRHRAVVDYIAGMTDRYALREHARLCNATAKSVTERVV